MRFEAWANTMEECGEGGGGFLLERASIYLKRRKQADMKMMWGCEDVRERIAAVYIALYLITGPHGIMQLST